MLYISIIYYLRYDYLYLIADDLLTPTIITWNGGGHIVYVTGTFNRWRRKIKMLKRYYGNYIT
jgi:hypothetical protein